MGCRFAVILVACIAVGIMDVVQGQIQIGGMDAGEFYGNVIEYMQERGCLIRVTGLCLACLTGSAMYAQDYEENAVYMRIQRMGTGKYIRRRIAQTAVSAFLLGFLSFLVTCLLIRIYCQVPFGPDPEIAAESASTLEQAGAYGIYILMASMQEGCFYMFYALMAMLISLFVPRRKVVAALPILIWYVIQYILPFIPGFPSILMPRTWFTQIFDLAQYLRIRDELGLIILFGIIGIFAVITYVFFYFRLQKKGIFGGERE